jgi:hypothetical protein
VTRGRAGQTGAMSVNYVSSPVQSFLFDLDGTLIDSVYQHVIAWRAALRAAGCSYPRCCGRPAGR